MPFCIFCGTHNDDNAVNCSVCNASLHQVATATPTTAPPALETMPAPEAPVSPVATAVAQTYVPPAPVYTPPVAPTPAPSAPPSISPPVYPSQSAQAPKAPTQRTEYVDEAPPVGSRYAVLGSANIWFSIFFMHIPIIGWITCLVWAFSRKGNMNRRNLARATLVSILIEIASWLHGLLCYC